MSPEQLRHPLRNARAPLASLDTVRAALLHGRRNRSGFTIIELMISMTILSFISLFVYQNTSRSFELRENLSIDGDFYNSIRVALDTFGRDMVHVWTPQSLALPGAMGKPPAAPKPGEQQTEQLNTQIYDFWGALINKQGVRPTRLTGAENKLSFVSNSHMRLFRETQECEFARISYSLDDTKDGHKAFVKHESTDAFATDRPDKDKDVSYTLLPAVKSLKFKYLNGEKDQWDSSWDSAALDKKGAFPSLVELQIELELPKSGSSFIVTQWYRPEIP